MSQYNKYLDALSKICSVDYIVHDRTIEWVIYKAVKGSKGFKDNINTPLKGIDIDGVKTWWRVSPFWQQELRKNGEIVIQAFGHYYWGRKSDFDNIVYDKVIQNILDNM